VPKNVELVVDARYVREIYMEGVHLSEDGETSADVQAKFRQRWRRATDGMRKYNVIANASADMGEKDEAGKPRQTSFVWFTGRPVSGNVTIRGVRVTEPEKLVTAPDDSGNGPELASHDPAETGFPL
jgi:hypothetical protein